MYFIKKYIFFLTNYLVFQTVVKYVIANVKVYKQVVY